MKNTFAFDIYGTLIDTQGVSKQLYQFIGDQADAFSNQWRDKQLEYSFRRGLMGRYENFGVCTSDALDFTDAVFSTGLSASQKTSLLECYSVLPAFENVKDSLLALKDQHVDMYAFSNGPAEAVRKLLANAGLFEFFIDVVSTDEIQSFKPNPEVYKHFLTRANSAAEHTWLISSNSFDVLGAKSAGLKSVWLQRNPMANIDPWDIKPDAVISELNELNQLL